MKYFYLLGLLAGVFRWRDWRSFNLVALVLVSSEFLMNALRPHLWAFVGTLTLSEAVIVWCSTWSLCYLLSIWLIHFSHSRFKVAMGREATVISISMLSLIALQVIRYVDAIYLETSFISDIYRWGIPSINLSMGGYMLYSFFNEVRNDRRIRVSSSS